MSAVHRRSLDRHEALEFKKKDGRERPKSTKLGDKPWRMELLEQRQHLVR